MLKLMYITGDPQIALIAEAAGVDRIFVDMETVGKELRQGGMKTVQSRDPRRCGYAQAHLLSNDRAGEHLSALGQRTCPDGAAV